MKLKPLKAALVGAGNRGCAYADYALSTPQELSIVAVIEPNALRRCQAGETLRSLRRSKQLRLCEKYFAFLSLFNNKKGDE